MDGNPRVPLRRNLLLFAGMAAASLALVSWKLLARSEAGLPAEPVEVVETAAARARLHSRTASVVGTVVAGHAITLRNELPGTVARVALTPGAVVNAGDVLVQLDVSIEQAEQASLEVQARLANVRLNRLESLGTSSAVSKMDVDTARAESEMALAQVQRVKALIARKTLRAPFRARVGITDLSVGQYLEEGQQVTTLQSVDEPAFIDFRVPQAASPEMRAGAEVSITGSDQRSIGAVIIATDSLVETASRSMVVRARVLPSEHGLVPGSAVTVRLPVSRPQEVVAIPASATRRGPDGDFVFVVRKDDQGELRAWQRRVVVESRDAEFALINDGLVADEVVATAGSFKLRDAIRVNAARD